MSSTSGCWEAPRCKSLEVATRIKLASGRRHWLKGRRLLVRRVLERSALVSATGSCPDTELGLRESFSTRQQSCRQVARFDPTTPRDAPHIAWKLTARSFRCTGTRGATGAPLAFRFSATLECSTDQASANPAAPRAAGARARVPGPNLSMERLYICLKEA